MFVGVVDVVVLGAEKCEVVEVGASAFGPRDDVVDLAHPVRAVTARSGARAVARDERLADLGGGAALAVAEIQLESRPVPQGGEDVGVTEQTSGTGGADGGGVVEFAAAVLMESALKGLGVDEDHDVDVGTQRLAPVVAELAAPARHVDERVGVALRAGEVLGADAVGVGVLGAPAGFGESPQFVLEQGELLGRQDSAQPAHAVVGLERGGAAPAALAEVSLGTVVAADAVGPAA